MRISIERDDELGRLAEDFNHMAGALARNEQLRRQWIADISHELRTPIAILRSEIEALIDGIRQTSPQRLHNLHDEVLNLGKLVDDLYELALSDQGSLDYRREPLDLSDLVDQVVEGFGHASIRELDLVNHLSAPMPFNGDKRRLQQLFVNLLENSLRYTDPGGALMIDQQSRSNAYLIRLMDTKPGVLTTRCPACSNGSTGWTVHAAVRWGRWTGIGDLPKYRGGPCWQNRARSRGNRRIGSKYPSAR